VVVAVVLNLVGSSHYRHERHWMLAQRFAMVPESARSQGFVHWREPQTHFEYYWFAKAEQFEKIESLRSP
jgi:hypothetical protein